MPFYLQRDSGSLFVTGRFGPGDHNILEHDKDGIVFWMTKVCLIMVIRETLHLWFRPDGHELYERRLAMFRSVSLEGELSEKDRSDPCVRFKLTDMDYRPHQGCRIRYGNLSQAWMPVKFFVGEVIAYLGNENNRHLPLGGLGPGVAEEIRKAWEKTFDIRTKATPAET
jgi:hypothetical protein